MPAIIRLDKLTKHFGPHTALNEVSFEVPPGTVFALLGDNGAGKTTAIRIMLGLLEASSGEAEVLGLDSAVKGLEIRRRVGYVSERPTLYEWMTVEEIGWFAAGFYDDEYLPRYCRLIADFDLPGRAEDQDFSKGMRAKVSLSLALAFEPELLVLDEPTSGLDALVRREFLESMVDRAAAGRPCSSPAIKSWRSKRWPIIVAILCQSNLLLVERLDELKRQIREVTLTLAAGAVPPEVSGEILSRRQKAAAVATAGAEHAGERACTAAATSGGAGGRTSYAEPGRNLRRLPRARPQDERQSRAEDLREEAVA